MATKDSSNSGGTPNSNKSEHSEGDSPSASSAKAFAVDSQAPSSPAGCCETQSGHPNETTYGPQRQLSPSLRKLWEGHFKCNPFGHSLSRYRCEIPDEDCLVWLNCDVREMEGQHTVLFAVCFVGGCVCLPCRFSFLFRLF